MKPVMLAGVKPSGFCHKISALHELASTAAQNLKSTHVTSWLNYWRGQRLDVLSGNLLRISITFHIPRLICSMDQNGSLDCLAGVYLYKCQAVTSKTILNN